MSERQIEAIAVAILVTDRLPISVHATAYAFMRLPRSLSIRIPSASSTQMLHSHLELRQRMIQDLNIDVIPDRSIDTFFKQVQKTGGK